MVSNPDWRGERLVKIEALHERLALAVESLVSGEDWIRAIVFAAQFRSRSFSNTLLIYAQHAERFAEVSVSEPFPSYVAGFRQWESLSRSVMKGQKGYMIQAPVTERLATQDTPNGASVRKLGFREPAKPGEQVKTRMINVKPRVTRHLCVLDRCCWRVNLPRGCGLAGLIAAEGFSLDRVASAAEFQGANGRTDFLEMSVLVRMDMDDAQQVKTLAHELAHARMHNPENTEAWGHRRIGEMETESVAMMIGAAHGMPTDTYTIPYMSGWATTVEDKSPLEVVQATGSMYGKRQFGLHGVKASNSLLIEAVWRLCFEVRLSCYASQSVVSNWGH